MSDLATKNTKATKEGAGGRCAKYKPTGIPWLPEVPEGWEVRPLRYSFESSFSGAWGSEKGEAEVDLVCYRVADFDYEHGGLSDKKLTVRSYRENEVSDKRVKFGDLLIEKSGGGDVSPVGRVVWVDKGYDATCSNFIQQLRCKRNFDSKFLCLVFRYLYSRKINGYFYNQTIGIQNLKVARYLSLSFPLPPLPTQRAIVAFLDEKCGKVDRLVAAKEKEVALLKELRERVIADAVTKGVGDFNAEAQRRRERRGKTKPSGIPWLPEVPEGWEVRRLGAFFTDDVRANKDFVFTRALKFNYGELVPKNEIGEPDEYRDVYVKYSVLQKDDILINGLNLNYDFVSQRVAQARCDGIITSAYLVLRPRTGVFSDYFSYLFKAMDYMKMFHGMGSGIRLTLSFRELKSQLLPLPPLAEQKAIVAYIEARAEKIDAAVAKLEAEVAALKEYKQRLIADVVTGQRRVA